MPQLIPYFFVNQLSFTLLVLLSLIFVFSKYILPYFVYLSLTRIYITTLN
jgi:F-type H+-transporting ATPase subunit 8